MTTDKGSFDESYRPGEGYRTYDPISLEDYAKMEEQSRQSSLGELWVQFALVFARQYGPIAATLAADEMVAEYDKRRCRPGKETWGL